MPDSDDDKTEDFAAMLADYERESGTLPSARGRRGPRPGDTVRGRIVSIGGESVFIDLGGKSEGALSILEVRDPQTGKLSVAPGDEMEAIVVENDENGIVLRRKLGRGKDAAAEVAQAFEHGIPVEGLVTSVNKGGVEVQIAGTRAFCPISQLELRHVEDASIYVGQKLSFRITRFEPGPRGRDNIVLSRRALLEAEQKERAVATRAELRPGAILRGTVSSLKDYGAFIDLGGLEGMLHVSEIGFARIGHPGDVLSVGQSVEVQILRIEKSEDPKRPEKIALSLKSLEKDPWSEVAQRFPDGTRLRGKVMRVETFGAFVELAPGVEGLLHVSELGKNVKHAKQAVKIGDPIDVTVLSVDREGKRISLSLGSGDPDGGDRSAPPAATDRFGTFGDLVRGAGNKK